MQPKREPLDLSRAGAMLREAHNSICWRAYTSLGNSPGLYFGKKVRRAAAESMMHSRRWMNRPDSWYTGEIVFIAWCSWRLDAPDRPITSSDDDARAAAAGIERLTGRSLLASTLTPPAADVELHFSGDLTLKVFCDHVPGSPSFDGNWELQVRMSSLLIGPGSYCSYIAHETDAIDPRDI